MERKVFSAFALVDEGYPGCTILQREGKQKPWQHFSNIADFLGLINCCIPAYRHIIILEYFLIVFR